MKLFLREVYSYSLWKEKIGGVLISEDIAQFIVFAYQLPQRLCIREIVLYARRQDP